MSKTRVADTRVWVSHVARARPSPPSSLPRYFIPAIIIIIITLRSVGIPHTRTIAPDADCVRKRYAPVHQFDEFRWLDEIITTMEAYKKSIYLETIGLFQYVEMLQLSAIGI